VQRLLALPHDEELRLGEKYLVPCVQVPVYDINIFSLDMPVLGPPHDDKEINQGISHYHIDFRFVTDAELKAFGVSEWDISVQYKDRVQGIKYVGHLFMYEAAKTYVRELNQNPGFLTGGPHHIYWEAFREKLRRSKFKLNRQCMVCPHKGTHLNGIKPKDGKLLCPSHGLAFNSETLEVSE
jgi:hypothetical protein